MKRLLTFALAAGVAVLAVALIRSDLSARQANGRHARAEPACADCPKCTGHAAPTEAPKARPGSDEEAVAELVAILDGTRSPDTFVAVLVALGRYDEKTALPAVIRNAERLGLLRGLAAGKTTTPAQQAVAAFLAGQESVARRCCTAPYAPAPGGCCPAPASLPVTTNPSLAPPVPSAVPVASY
jgi:hypothetical protein